LGGGVTGAYYDSGSLPPPQYWIAKISLDY
jgi:hypothetical protein